MNKHLTTGLLVLRGALMLSVVVVLCLSLAACSSQKEPEEIIRSGVSQQFDSLKQTLKSAMASNTSSTSFGIDSDHFVSTWLEGFSYSIDNILIDGDSATATVTVHCRLLSEALELWDDKLTAFVSNEATSSLSQEEINGAIGELLLGSLEDTQVQTTKIDLPYVKEGNSWKPGDGFQTKLSSAFVG